MSVKTDLLMVAGVAVALVAAAYYVKGKIGDGLDVLGELVPDVVKEGVGAAGVLTANALQIAVDPLDGFGILPKMDQYGGELWWVQTTPWENRNDPVSNNDTGINFNYF